ncbi:MAG: zinc-binding dehydrogenase [Pseudomonadota bacterium]
MKALIYSAHGGTDVLEYTDVAPPSPKPDDVVVDVVATSVNHLDLIQRAGYFTLDGYTLPHIAGMDVVGTISEVGANVTSVAVGDRVVIDPSMHSVPDGSTYAGDNDLYGALGVIGATLNGGYAQQCLAPHTHVHKIPDHISFERAVVFPTAWMTAHHALVDVGKLQAGESIMIHAAASGVSIAAIQWAKSIGATVFATAGSEEKCQKALELGADFACNNRTEDIAKWARENTGGKGVNMVFDHVGKALWAPSMFSLAVRGRLVNVGNTSGDTATIPSLGFMYHMGIQILGSDPYRHDEFPGAWASYCAADFDPVIDSTYALEDGAAAQKKLEDGAAVGKLILKP